MFDQLAADQAALNSYAEKFPEKTLVIDERQKKLNSRFDAIEEQKTLILTLHEQISEFDTARFNAGYLKGKEHKKRHTHVLSGDTEQVRSQWGALQKAKWYDHF
jgi:hypothetical protein